MLALPRVLYQGRDVLKVETEAALTDAMDAGWVVHVPRCWWANADAPDQEPLPDPIVLPKSKGRR